MAIERFYFKKKINLENLLARYSGIYAVDSLVSNSIKYGISDGQFAVFTTDGVAKCPIREAQKLASQMKDERVKQEILDLYEDVKDIEVIRASFNLRGAI